MNRIYRIKAEGVEAVEEGYDLAGRVIGLAMKVHGKLGPGFLESVYVKALGVELTRAGMPFEMEKRLQVHYDEQVVGEFIADVLVAPDLIVEAKAVLALAPAHGAQLVNYLAATKLDIGLLLNFGAPRLEFQKKFREYRAKQKT